ncbi:Uncharacterised protein [Legionella moravica]|uniref:Uncharacterized protein n=1 Tax=Legionella moravica TaxID=39962 RepID=A0A378JT03_9GAMM|nr:Uncharacterised protein [Legionella moravica]
MTSASGKLTILNFQLLQLLIEVAILSAWLQIF